MPLDLDPTMSLPFLFAAVGFVLTRQIWRWFKGLQLKVRAKSKRYKDPDGWEFDLRASWKVRNGGIPRRRVFAASAYLYDKR